MLKSMLHSRNVSAFGLLALFLPACAGLTPEQQAAVSKVQVLRSDPAANCQNLGTVSGSAESDDSGGIKAKTVLMGGNTARVDEKGTVHSTATVFYCPDR